MVLYDRGFDSLRLYYLAPAQNQNDKLLCVALSLILGGALGNVLDRLMYGAVVDFIDLHYANWHWPAFNIADSAICIGAALIIWGELRKSFGKSV